VSKPNDATLIADCVRGDRAAQRQLYEQYKLPLYRVCLRYARDKQEAEDWLHEAFLVIFRDLGQFRQQGPLGGWLRRVTINVALQQLRRQKRTVYPTVDLAEVEVADNSREEEVPPVAMQVLVEAIQELPPGYRAVFNLFVVEQYSHQRIAEELAISVGASKSQLSKAKRMLRERLGTQLQQKMSL
jgi:RNA polymerase sigma-70 factor (ECF subfamily)